MPAGPAIPAMPASDTGPPVFWVCAARVLARRGGVRSGPAGSTAARDPEATGAVWFVSGRVRASCVEPGAAVDAVGPVCMGSPLRVRFSLPA